LRSWDQIIHEGRLLANLGAWLHVGDVFDARSTPDDRAEVAQRFQAMGEVAPVLVAHGNHCAPGDLPLMAKLKSRHPIYVAVRPEVFRFTLATGEAAAWGLIPYPHRSALVAAGVPHQDIGTAAAVALDAICMSMAHEMAEARTQGALVLLAGHGTLAGARTSAGQPMGLDGDIAFTATMLERFGDIPKLFGHIHAPQELYGAWYTGSIAASDWSEIEEKRYCVVSWDGTRWAMTSHPLDTPKLYHIDGRLTPDGFDWTCDDGDEAHQAGPGFFAGSEVRVRYHFLAAEKAALDESLVRAPFVGAARLDVEPIALRTRSVRAPEVAAAVTLDQKVQAFVRSAGLDWSPGLDAKLAALQQPDGAAFLTEVQQNLPESQRTVSLSSPTAADLPAGSGRTVQTAVAS